MADSKIEWTDATWNPVTGCTRASEGCDNCYAVQMTKRLEAMGQDKYKGLVNIGKNHFNGVVKCHEDALLKPFEWKTPKRIFVNSMSDLFHKDVPFEFIDKVFAVMALNPQHMFQILTKRPERMAEYLNTPGRVERINDTITVPEANGGFAYMVPEEIGDHLDSIDFQTICWPLPNVWLGTSVENQEQADKRIPHLLNCPAMVRFLSCEPLLGDVSLTDSVSETDYCANFEHWDGDPDEYEKILHEGIHWVIVGGESGPNARPMHPEWARSLRDQCVAAGVPFFFKQWGEWGDTWSDHAPRIALRGNEFAPGWNGAHRFVHRVGKNKAGRLLDGREWNEYPEVRS